MTIPVVRLLDPRRQYRRGGGRFSPGSLTPVSYDFFVSPTGGTGAGSFESPWSLAYAAGTGAGTAQGDGKLPTTGARIAVRGGTGGTQVKYNVSTIAFAAHGSIGSGVDNPDGKLIWEGYRSSTYAVPERACIFGTATDSSDYCWINGDYQWFLCLENAHDWVNRDNGANGGANFWIRSTIDGTKIAHCDLHDGGNGVFADANGSNSATNGRVEIYANCIRNQGWNQTGSPSSSAHGFYLHHKSSAAGRMRVEENIMGSTFAYCCQLYDADPGSPPDTGTNTGHVEDIDYNGNVHFNAGVLSGAPWPTDSNMLALGGEQALVSILAADNFFYWPNGYGDACIIASYRASAAVGNGVLTILRPYCVGGGSGYGMVNIRGHFATQSNLTIQDGFFRDGRVGNRGMIRISDPNSVSGFNMSGNVWARAASDLAWASNNTGSFSTENIVRRRFSGTLPTWSNDTGLSAGTTQNNDPTTNAVFVRPTTRFYSGRGNVIIYNWEGLSNVSVDLSTILSNGDSYAIYDNRDPWNSVATGIYTGATVSFPMSTQVTDPTPIGGLPASAAPATTPTFNAFMVRKTG